MTPAEITKALSDLKSKVGPRADLNISLSDDRSPGREVYASLYPYGMGASSKGYLSVNATTFEDAIASLGSEWERHADQHRAQTTRSMALAIIRITTELGECTDASLRQEFDASAIARWSDDACKLADEMAGKGPFRVKRKRGANAA